MVSCKPQGLFTLANTWLSHCWSPIRTEVALLLISTYLHQASLYFPHNRYFCFDCNVNIVNVFEAVVLCCVKCPIIPYSSRNILIVTTITMTADLSVAASLANHKPPIVHQKPPVGKEYNCLLLPVYTRQQI